MTERIYLDSNYNPVEAGHPNAAHVLDAGDTVVNADGVQIYPPPGDDPSQPAPDPVIEPDPDVPTEPDPEARALRASKAK